MAYDETLAERVIRALAGQTDVEAKKMFGGVGYLLHGNMACGAHGDELIVRVGPEAYEGALADPHARSFDMTGRAMKGWVFVAHEAVASEEDLRRWVERGVRFALTLPPK